jgi:hypothetical protein
MRTNSDSPFAALPLGVAGVVLADPPWSSITRSAKGEKKSASQHYSCMTIEEICALPVASLCAADAILLLWVPPVHLLAGLRVMMAWSFDYKTGGSWAKQSRSEGGGGASAPASFCAVPANTSWSALAVTRSNSRKRPAI